jgi:hypothetical protein
MARFVSGRRTAGGSRETGVATRVESGTAAPENLDDAVTLHGDERGRTPTDEKLRGAGVDPADTTSGEQEPSAALG